MSVAEAGGEEEEGSTLPFCVVFQIVEKYLIASLEAIKMRNKYSDMVYMVTDASHW